MWKCVGNRMSLCFYMRRFIALLQAARAEELSGTILGPGGVKATETELAAFVETSRSKW
jgi:hypothetical protein